MRPPTTPLVLTALLLAALPTGATAQQADDDQAFLRVPVPEEGEDRIHRLRTQVRHTTVIVLPAGETILDFVVGDSEYWHLAGAANVAFLKPLASDAATNIALVCESGRIYSFLVAEQSDGPPHLVVRVESGAEAARLSGGSGRPAFVARSEVAAYQQMAAEAAEAARSAREAAEVGILEARSQAEAAIEEFRAGYPERLAFEYRLDGDAAERPFLVEAMWHDGQFTYVRSHAQESPALYELRDGEPALVAYDLTEDGLYVARHVLGDGWLQIGDKRAAWRFTPQGSAPMSRWKQWVSPPEGALPGGIVTKAGVVLIAVLVGGLLFSWAMTGPQEADTLVALPDAQAVDDGMGRSLQNRIRAEAERQTLEAAARARAELERRQAATAEEMARLQAESETPNTAALIPGIGPAESELREALRLEELERRTRSLRALPVAQSYRDPNATAESSEAGTGDAADADVAVLENAVQAALASFEQSLGALENELEAGLAGEQLLLGSPGIATAAAPLSGQQASRPAPSPIQPGRSVRPADPPGWERIYEGSFLEGVLLTQLTGDFPGPVLATVSVPFYSADRQRILIPRGARVVGTARAVQDPDQSRLAVAFHRLIMPDGSWIDLEFTGLNQAGEGALRDQVDRHYFSTFAAAGAIGVVSGLALAGGSPFGLRAGVGQGLGQSATSVLDRFLNRLPTLTIRAGHRLRIWFTSDVLVPRAGTRQ